MQLHSHFDAVLSFDLAGAGGLAWRIGRDLGIPAAGWATGGDVRYPLDSSYGQNVARTLRNLDIVFYQSHELLEEAAGLLGTTSNCMPGNRHIVLSRGIARPPCLNKEETRKRVRNELGVLPDEVLILNIGRISRDKGAFDLIDATSLAAARDKRIICVLIGSNPAFDETIEVQRHLDKISHEKRRIRLLPACAHDKVWEYLCAADIFAFTSHHEGMPNSLLEAMAMGVPSVAFAIPPVVEIEVGTGAIVLVPPRDTRLFAEALLRLADCPEERSRIEAKGKQRVMERFMVQKSMAEAVRRLGMIRNEKIILDKR